MQFLSKLVIIVFRNMTKDADHNKAVTPSASLEKLATWRSRFEAMLRGLPKSGWLLIGIICVTGLLEDFSIAERIIERARVRDMSVLFSPIVLILGIFLIYQTVRKAENKRFNMLIALIGMVYGLFGVFLLTKLGV